MKTAGLIGFGTFGQFLAGHLTPHFEVCAFDARDRRQEARKIKVRPASLAGAASQEIVILAVPVQRLEGVLKKIRPLVRPGALVMDVCSVKVEPLRWMARLLPRSVDILGTHPLFGPQSGKRGIAGLTIAVCPVRGRRAAQFTSFFSRALKLKVIRMSPKEHDRRMAHVQGLTHLIGRAVEALRLPAGDPQTTAYRKLLELRDLLRHDSDALFEAIEGLNPYAGAVRRKFLRLLTSLDNRF